MLACRNLDFGGFFRERGLYESPLAIRGYRGLRRSPSVRRRYRQHRPRLYPRDAAAIRVP